MSNPIISIIIPLYNKSEYINQCIDSLVKQTYSNIEVVCVDDKSQDNSLAIVEEYARKDSRIRVLKHEVNSGAMKSRSTGVKAALGKYILFIDADDELELYACEMLYAISKQHKADIYGFGTLVKCQDETERIKTQNILNMYSGHLYNRDILTKSFLDIKMTRNIWDKMYESTLCKKAYEIICDNHKKRGVNPITADNYAFMVLAYHAVSFFGIQDKLYKYYYGRGVTGPDELSLERFEEYCMSAIDADNFYSFFSSRDVLDQYVDVADAFRDRVINRCIGAWSKQINKQDKAEALKIMVHYWKYVSFYERLSNIWDEMTMLKSWEVPFSLLPKGGRIVLYGAGDMGKDYYRQITNSGICDIVLWVDSNYNSLKDLGLQIHSPIEINNISFDSILIAILNNRVKSNIKQLLIETYSVSESKII